MVISMVKTIEQTKAIEKLVTVTGTIVGENETKKLHTSTCSCGKTMVRANKESSLNHYTNNAKWTAKCCKSMLTYTGEQFFKGTQLFVEIETPIVDKKQNVKKPQTKKQINDETGLLAKYIKKSINATALWNAIKDEYYNDEEKLTVLFNAYPEQFRTAVKYLKKDINTLSLSIIE